MELIKRSFSALIICLLVIPALAQESGQELRLAIDEVTYQWDQYAYEIDDWNGLTLFCKNDDFRKEILGLMNDIHHYDSALYVGLKKIQRQSSNREVNKTIHEIEQFETEYSIKDMIRFMHQECRDRKEIVNKEDELKADLGMESYDGQIMLVEKELASYVKHVTKKIDNIREHAHHIIQ